MPAHVLHGDSFLVRQEFKRLEAQAGAADLLEANRHRVGAGQARLPELLSTCRALPFIDERRLVVVEGLLASLEPRSGRGRSQQGASARRTFQPLGPWEGLSKAVPELPPSTLLVFLDGPLSESNPLLRSLRPVSQVRALHPPIGEALARWIKATAQAKGCAISPAAINCLADLVGNDLWALDQELEKLYLYAAGRGIEESDVRELVSQVREASIFAAVDAVIERRAGAALRLVRQLRQDGRDPSNIISMVQRQLRLLALVRDLSEGGVPRTEWGDRLGISQFVLRRTAEQARRLSLGDIRWRYQRLLEADLSLKQGRLDPDLALELLVADLAGPTP